LVRDRLAERPAAIIVAAVLCTLLAAIEQPDKVSMAAPDRAHRSVPVFATQFYLMPLAVDFPSMAVALHRGC